MTMSCAVMAMSTACRKAATTKTPAASMNCMRFRLARLQALSSRCMYSEHWFDALIRPLFGQVCQSLMVVSNCIPGSPHWWVASAISRRMVLVGLAADELDDVRVVGVQYHHLGRAPRLPARLDDPGRRVGRAHERHGARG